MHRRNSLSPARLWRPGLSLAIAITGFATAALVGVAMAKSFTLKIEKNAKVMNQHGVTKHENILTAHGFAVYLLTGDSKHHPECVSSACLQAWPPVKVSSAKKLSKAPGISGKLGVWHHKGFNQVTLGGHPLYLFIGDKSNGAANGEGVNIGHHDIFDVVTASAKAAGGQGAGTGSGTGTNSGTGTTTTTQSSTLTSTTSTTTSYWG